MSLLFHDTLQVTDGTGIYSLKALINGVWTHVYTISATQNGSIAIDSAINTIDVDTSLLPIGQTFDFMWVDSAGYQSNIVTALVPFTILDTYSVQEDITWTNNGGDSWTFTIPYTPPPDDLADTLFNGVIFYNDSGNTVLTDATGITSTQSYSFSGNGAGTYIVSATYSRPNNADAVICEAIIMVDGSGNVLRSLVISGFTDVSFSGMNISCTANYQATNATISGCSYIAFDGNFSNPTGLGSIPGPLSLSDQPLPAFTTPELFILCQLLLVESEWTPGVVTGFNSLTGCLMTVRTNIQ